MFNHYRLFAIEQLNKNRIDHICNKDDVDFILLDIYNELGLLKNEDFENYFSELLSFSTIGKQMEDWLALVKFIEM